MPPLVIAVVAAAASYGASAVAAGALAGAVAAGTISAATALVIGAVVGAIVGGVVAMGLGMLFQTKAKTASVESTAADQKQMVRSSVQPRRVIYGVAKVSGPILYAASSGADMQNLHLVVALAGHEVQAVDSIWIEDVGIPTSSLVGGTVTGGKYANVAGFGIHLGNQTEADGSLVAETPDGWDADHRLLGICYLHCRLVYNREAYSGIPNISAIVVGRNKIYDPRSNTYGFTTNWALCVLDYLMADFGLACSIDEIDLASFIAAANLSDEQVPLNAGGTVTQARYTVNGTFTLDEAPIAVMEKLLASGAGALVYVAGQYRLHGGAYVTPSASIGPADFAGSVELQTMPPRAELFNGVRGTFIDPNRFFQASEYPLIQDPVALAEDGEEVWREVDLAFCDDPTRAQRLARQTLYRMRAPLTLKASVRYAAIQFSIWQTVAVTLPDFGWTAKPFRISAFTFSPSDGTVTLTLTEEQVAAYAWLYDAAYAVPDNPNTTLADPLSIPAPEWVSAIVSTAIQADGTIAPALDVSWAAAANPFVSGHEVQWQVPGGAWLSKDVAMPTLFAVLEPVISGQVYNVRVRGIAGLARGLWSALATPTAGADVTPPSVPGSVTTAGVLRGVAISWTMPPERDLAAIEVYEGATTSIGSRVLIGETRASVFLRTGLPADTTRQYWVRARDRSGNLSAFVGPVAGTSSYLLTDDIGNAILTTAKFAASIKPVEIITGTASTAPENTVAVNTEDGLLYTFKDGAWRKTIQGLGPEGLLTSEQIEDLDAHKVIGTLDNADFEASRLLGQIGNTQIQAGAITASKLSLVPGSLNADPYFQDLGAWTATAGGWIFQARATGNPVDALGVPAGIALPASFTGTAVFQVAGTGRFPVTPGERITLRLKGQNAGNRPIFAFLAYLDAAGTYLGGGNVITFAAGDAAQHKELQDVVMAGAAVSYLTVYVGSGAAWTGTAAISDAIIVKPATASMIVDGAISADKIAANAVTAAKIDANAVTAGKIAAGAVTTSKLSVGSANQIWNSCLTRTADGWGGAGYGSITVPWILGSSYPNGLGAWAIVGAGSGYLRLPTYPLYIGQGVVADWKPNAAIVGIACVEGERWQARALLGTHRCEGQIEMIFISPLNVEISRVSSVKTSSPSGGAIDSNWAPHTLLGTVPAGATYILLRMNMIGTGESDPVLFFSKTMLGKAPPNATEVGEWAAGGVTEISGGQLRAASVTAEVMAANSIAADSIQANAVVFGKVAAGAIRASEIFGGEIRAVHLASEEIISDSIQVRNLVVGTDKITAEAVSTLAISEGYYGGTDGTNGYIVALDFGIAVAQTRSGSLMLTWTQGYTATPRTSRIRIDIDGVNTREFETNATVNYNTITTGLTFSPGVHQVTVRWLAEPGCLLYAVNAVVLVRAK